RRPWIAGIFALMLLSLAGIPLTAGFVGKFYVMAAGVDSALWVLLVLFVINSVIGLFFYLRIIVVMSTEKSRDDHQAEEAHPAVPASYADGLVLATLSGLLLWLGLYPAPLIHLVQTMERSLMR
ncbi:MAG: proton-conducting transporter membrane subunit, partial [Nitrospiraceae bacterium]